MEKINEKLNLCEILKGCPKGTKLYSTIYGEVFLDGVSSDKDDFYPILYSRGNNSFSATSDGRIVNYDDAECCLFPSRETRDWSTFKPKKERFDSKTLKPFDKVLVRHYYCSWHIEYFSHFNASGVFPYVCINSGYKYCIPYNDDTKHLIGTTDDAPEYYKYWWD